MLKKRIYQYLSAASLTLAVAGCATPKLAEKAVNRSVPASYTNAEEADADDHQEATEKIREGFEEEVEEELEEAAAAERGEASK